MPTYEIFFGDKEQCNRVMKVIGYAKEQKTTDATCNVMEAEIVRGPKSCWVVVLYGPALNAVQAGYLAAVADGIILECDFRREDKEARKATRPAGAVVERFTFWASSGGEISIQMVVDKLCEAAAKCGHRDSEGPTRIGIKDQRVEVEYEVDADDDYYNAKARLAVLCEQANLAWLHWRVSVETI